MGISSMRERAELQGGRCEISSLPGGGTTVRVWVPETPDPSIGTTAARETSGSAAPSPALTG
jgi:signal transduction histidine kinase